MELDEGSLTAAVIAPYAAEDGKRGQSAAEAVLPLRRALWRTAETYAPARLAACLRVRARATDQTGRGGVRELRQALADWLDPPPTCKRCHRVIVPGSEKVGCGARRGGPNGAPGRRLACLPDRRPAAVRAGREARCGTLALFAPTLADPHVAAAWQKFSGAADVVCDRDGRALLAATAPKGARLPPEFAEALASLAASMHMPGGPLASDPGPPPQVLGARRRFERAVDDAIRANGRLILATQVKYYKAAGATMRADLVQGAAMGLRRALMDYDASAVHKNGMTARIASYSIPWIRQGAGEAYAERDLLGTPDWVGALRRKVESAGVAPADLLRAALHLAEAACRATPDSPGFDARADAAVDLAVLLCDRSTVRDEVLAMAHDARRAATPPAPKASKATTPPAPPTKQDREKQEERSAERILAWAAGILEVEATGSGLLAALRHGAPVYVATGADDDDSDDGARGSGGASIKDSRRVAALTSGEHEDIEAVIAEEEDAALKWRRASTALTDLRKHDPEAAEVIRRRRGLDGLGEEEALESIAATGLTCTGRAICRESVRQLQKRGEAVLRRRAATGPVA